MQELEQTVGGRRKIGRTVEAFLQFFKICALVPVFQANLSSLLLLSPLPNSAILKGTLQWQKSEWLVITTIVEFKWKYILLLFSKSSFTVVRMENNTIINKWQYKNTLRVSRAHDCKSTFTPPHVEGCPIPEPPWSFIQLKVTGLQQRPEICYCGVSFYSSLL